MTSIQLIQIHNVTGRRLLLVSQIILLRRLYKLGLVQSLTFLLHHEDKLVVGQNRVLGLFRRWDLLLLFDSLVFLRAS